MLLEPQRPVRTGNYLPAARFDIVMRRAKPTATELSFFFCGFLIIVVGWLADLLGIFELGAAVGEHGGGSSFQLRLFLTMFGVAFSTIGVGYENFPEILTDADMAKRYLVAFLFLADGSLHLYAFNDHLGDRFPAAFFAVFSICRLEKTAKNAAGNLSPRWSLKAYRWSEPSARNRNATRYRFAMSASVRISGKFS